MEPLFTDPLKDLIKKSKPSIKKSRPSIRQLLLEYFQAWHLEAVQRVAEREVLSQQNQPLPQPLASPRNGTGEAFLLQQVDATRENYQAAQEKFTKDVIAADKIIAVNNTKSAVDPQIDITQQAPKPSMSYDERLVAEEATLKAAREAKPKTAEERLADREAAYRAEGNAPKPSMSYDERLVAEEAALKTAREAKPKTAEERLADREAGYQAERKAGLKNEIPEMTLGELREPWPLKFGPYRGFDLG